MRGRNRIPFDRHPLARLLGAMVVVVGVLAAIVLVGLGGVFHFLFSFLNSATPLARYKERAIGQKGDGWA